METSTKGSQDHTDIPQRQQRRDIQGLRMVAVLLVLANHLCGMPQGGFVGVDVFFVISGFLITGNLLRMAGSAGNISFQKFYANRFRRIVPAATVVLLLIYLSAVVVFQPSRAHQIGVDAVFAAVFASNWRFAARGTDYFAANDMVSPIQHYWSLSIEEQFYCLWPAIIFAIGLVVARRNLAPSRRWLSGAAIGCVIAASFGWALHQTASEPTWAYFDTLARFWELGVGAFLATAVTVLERIPTFVRPFLSWGGLGIIALSALLISEGSPAFPAPLGVLPVFGSAMVIVAGIGQEPAHQHLLSNRVAVYIGNISYSLYLVHWPVIVYLSVFMAPFGVSYYLAALAIVFALAIASYRFVETPTRYGKWRNLSEIINEFRRGQWRWRVHGRREEDFPHTGILVLTLLVIGLTLLTLRPADRVRGLEREGLSTPTGGPERKSESNTDPLRSALQREIDKALTAANWPQLDPSMESVISDGSVAPPEMQLCAVVGIPDPNLCTWGQPDAPTKIMLVGDSIALTYGSPLRQLALNSGGIIQLHIEAMPGCQFVNDQMLSSVKEVNNMCPSRKQHTIDVIRAARPDVVIISNNYVAKTLLEGGVLDPDQWAESMRKMVDQLGDSVKKFVWLSAPPADKNVKECYTNKSSVPDDCISEVTTQWLSIARAEQGVAKSFGGVWIDSRPWFCSEFNATDFCPAFVGTTPTKSDLQHMTPAYGNRIYPVIGESFKKAGVY